MEKLLLLDEFDNTLNPSLIEALFIVIKEFFIDKGTMVIITTHSPVTISLAPEYTQFYEFFLEEKINQLKAKDEAYQDFCDLKEW